MTYVLTLSCQPWCTDDKNHVRLEFLYSSSSPRLCVRVLTELSACDGVTAIRLALHTLEAIEGNEVDSSKFKRNPPFSFGLRNVRNAASMILSAALDTFWPDALTVAVSAEEAAAPTTGAGLRSFYRTQPPGLALFKMYRPGSVAVFKPFVRMLDSWKKRTGWRGFFVLQNFSPHAAPAVVEGAEDLLDMSKRFAGIFMPVGAPPSGDPWRLMNYAHVRPFHAEFRTSD
jgi:hypothetical protein